jgi:hypothetical protein
MRIAAAASTLTIRPSPIVLPTITAWAWPGWLNSAA